MNYPTIMPAITLDFQNSQQLDPRVTFSRSSSATYINSAGMIAYADEHEARFEALGLLIEEERTNFTYPSIMPSSTTGTISVDGAIVTTNAGIAPDGTNTASLISSAGGTGNNRVYNLVGGTLRDETYSWFIKASSSDAVFSVFMVGGFIPASNVTYTFSTDTIGGFFSGYVLVEPYGNGWFRLSLTTEVVALSGSYWQIRNFTGDFFVWGMQREAGTFVTSLIPTSGSTVTRAADIAQITGNNFNWYNQSEGTIVIVLPEFPSKPTVGNRYLIAFKSINGSPQINTSPIVSIGISSTETNSRLGIGSLAGWFTTDQVPHNKFAFNYGGATSFYADGELRATAPSDPGSGIDRLSIRPNCVAAQHISRLVYYNERLTDAELQTLTS